MNGLEGELGLDLRALNAFVLKTRHLRRAGTSVSNARPHAPQRRPATHVRVGEHGALVVLALRIIILGVRRLGLAAGGAARLQGHTQQQAAVFVDARHLGLLKDVADAHALGKDEGLEGQQVLLEREADALAQRVEEENASLHRLRHRSTRD